MATLRRCDQCGAVTDSHAETHDWIEIVAPGDDGGHHHYHYHFCGWQCVADFATLKVLDPEVRK